MNNLCPVKEENVSEHDMSIGEWGTRSKLFSEVCQKSFKDLKVTSQNDKGRIPCWRNRIMVFNKNGILRVRVLSIVFAKTFRSWAIL